MHQPSLTSCSLNVQVKLSQLRKIGIMFGVVSAFVKGQAHTKAWLKGGHISYVGMMVKNKTYQQSPKLNTRTQILIWLHLKDSYNCEGLTKTNLLLFTGL